MKHFFFVAVDELCDDFNLEYVSISPRFNTLDEAKQFRDSCGSESAYCVEVIVHRVDNTT